MKAYHPKKLKISLDSDLSECSSLSTAKSNSSSSQKVGRKAVWGEKVITDMVDMICSSKYLRTNVIFRNTRARNMCYIETTWDESAAIKYNV